MALTSQFAGASKWEAELKSKEKIMHSWKWKGNHNYCLELFVAQHRNAYVTMTQCAEHVACQLPNECTRVGHLIDAIENSDPELQAAMVLVRNDETPNTGLRCNFEDAAATILPCCPVAQKQANSKRPNTQTSSAEGAKIGKNGVEISAFGAKVGKGAKTGVQL